ncbi:dymeclin-like isoform X2 [Tigriopus californicus]|uniref:dymeclin-like isoform X2 n=1 Tax=Tigriopus californicus TaxID=6832 RepID=UPI0027DAB03F|nr:dymeclin-like isoform X2 [Tigriopus californicus]
MGSSVSKLSHAPQGGVTANESLSRFISSEHLPVALPLWNTLISQPYPRVVLKSDWAELQRVTEEPLKRLCVNNLKTRNVATLLQIWLNRQEELVCALETQSEVFLQQSENILFLSGFVLKFMVERLKEEDLWHQFETADSDANPTVTMDRDLLREFIQSLIDLICSLPLTAQTLKLHVESVGVLIYLLSSTLTSAKPSFQVKTLQAFLTSDQAADLTCVLLQRYIAQSPAPASYYGEEGGSLVLGLANGMWNILTMGYSSVTGPALNEEQAEGFPESSTPLADLSVLLLLLLTNYCTENYSVPNPFRRALFSCANIQSDEKHVEDNEPGQHVESDDAGSKKKSLAAQEAQEPSDKVDENGQSPACRTDFSLLFETLCQTMHKEESTLVLYILLHRNSHFRTYLLASSNIEALMIPILKTLYFAKDSTNHHIYMSLIVLLILSEDDLFSTSVHDIMLKNVEWYAERTLSQISLGGIVILVIIRTIQYNMLKMRDKYLHSNCLASLANMSGQFKNLHPYVSQRLIAMFESLAKKHSRLIGTLHNVGEIEGLSDDSPLAEALADVSALEEVLRMILEIVNSCLFHQIKANANLIYALLYKKEVFQPFLTHPNFQDICQNIQLIISFFQARLDLTQDKKERILSVTEVQDVIRETAFGFPKEKLARFPDLKFKYVEEEQPEDFFVPYLWSLASRKLYWNQKFMPMTMEGNN